MIYDLQVKQMITSSPHVIIVHLIAQQIRLTVRSHPVMLPIHRQHLIDVMRARDARPTVGHPQRSQGHIITTAAAVSIMPSTSAVRLHL